MMKLNLVSLILICCWLVTTSACVNAANKKPIVNAGADQRVGFATLVTLDAKKSSDKDGKIKSYHWQQIKGPNVLLNSSLQAKSTFKTPVKVKNKSPLTLVFKLTVTDNQQATATDTITVHVVPYKINGTGITHCANATRNNLACPVAGFPGQDAQFSFETTNNTGQVSFSYTKLDKNGKALTKNAKQWACVRDNITGLIWEVKTNDGGLHDKDWTYYWFDGHSGTSTVQKNRCGGIIHCDTKSYIDAVNAENWCASKSWRLPSRHELVSLVNFAKVGLSIDSHYFPNTPADSFWTSSLQVEDHAEQVYFSTGEIGWLRSNFSDYVMLVRDGD